MGKMTFIPSDVLVDEVWGKVGTPERDRMEAELKKEIESYLMRDSAKGQPFNRTASPRQTVVI